MIKKIFINIVSFLGCCFVAVVGCGLLMNTGEKLIEVDGAVLAEQAGWKRMRCGELFTGREVGLCKTAISMRSLDESMDALDALEF